MLQRPLPPMVKNILILNIIMFAITNLLLYQQVVDLNDVLGLHYFGFSSFEPYQLFTHMFLHADVVSIDSVGFIHIALNMLALYMFGSPLEERLGSKRFLILYLVSGFGAAFIQLGAMHFELLELINVYDLSGISESELIRSLAGSKVDYSVVGASGCVFGLLAAFGMLFPNTELMLLFFPIPIKAKYFVVLYGIFELFSGVAHIEGDNVAHFAHVGGAIFGFLLIKYWKSKHIL
ncbi:MAG: rhomboid family intramembrane serine protease [Bacteroidetes bacterium]|nr:rhomboid family intramembrane serine protease [Bacteroidota bacterium]